MSDRTPLDNLTSDQLDALYAELDRLAAELADYDQRAEQQKQRADRLATELQRHAEAESADAAAGSYAGRAEGAETKLRRVAALADRWANRTDQLRVAADHIRAALAHDDCAIAQPGRWLHIAFTSPDEMSANTSALAFRDHLTAEYDGVSMQITTNAVEVESFIVCTTACDEQHTYDWTCEQFAGIDDSDPSDLTGYLAPEPGIGCLTAVAEPDPFGYEERERTGRNAGLTVEDEDAAPPPAA